MSLTQFVYSLYIRMLAIPLVLGLILFRWKRTRITLNLSLLGIPIPLGFFPRFYANASIDFLKVIHGHYGKPISLRDRDQGKMNILVSGSALFLSAHFHNWELMGSWLTQVRGIPLLSTALPLQQPSTQRLLKWLRHRLGIPVLNHAIPRSALRHLRSGKCFGMLWDQYSLHGNTSAEFFSHSVRMNPLPDFLLSKQTCPVFFGALLPGGRFRLIELLSQRSQPLTSAHLARRYHRVLEILVRSYPDLWYGLTHRRFKDLISYEVAGSVSRETTSRVQHLVSRET